MVQFAVWHSVKCPNCPARCAFSGEVCQQSMGRPVRLCSLAFEEGIASETFVFKKYNKHLSKCAPARADCPNNCANNNSSKHNRISSYATVSRPKSKTVDIVSEKSAVVWRNSRQILFPPPRMTAREVKRPRKKV